METDAERQAEEEKRTAESVNREIEALKKKRSQQRREKWRRRFSLRWKLATGSLVLLAVAGSILALIYELN